MSPSGAAPQADSSGAAGRGDHRYYERFRAGLRFRLSWQDKHGRTRKTRARVIDMNGDGALVQCGVPIAPGSFVYIQTQELGMMGSAHVRRCEPGLFACQLGLQFSAPLTTRF
jgi:hypothetical protein